MTYFIFLDVFKTISIQIQTYHRIVLSSSEGQKITLDNIEVEEEEKGGSHKDTSTKEKSEQVKAIIYDNPSMALPLGPNGIQHFCETMSAIFAVFTSGFISFIKSKIN